MALNLAPSYKAIAIAILKNDVSGESLGFTAKRSDWYYHLKTHGSVDLKCGDASDER